ncbi:hypothetical protein [Streptomyces sp. NPDC056160]|uniref:hypothetical protein n=1 Tax=Streptomyces sp. NPDC056160 TaxID=3345731 RepID=UPI0035DA437C
MASYSDVQRAVRVEKFRIWVAWFCAGLIALFAGRAVAVADIGTVGTIIQAVIGVVWLALTVTAFRMTNALNRRANAERREVLGDDYPG